MGCECQEVGSPGPTERLSGMGRSSKAELLLASRPWLPPTHLPGPTACPPQAQAQAQTQPAIGCEWRPVRV